METSCPWYILIFSHRSDVCCTIDWTLTTSKGNLRGNEHGMLPVGLTGKHCPLLSYSTNTVSSFFYRTTGHYVIPSHPADDGQFAKNLLVKVGCFPPELIYYAVRNGFRAFLVEGEI